MKDRKTQGRRGHRPRPPIRPRLRRRPRASSARRTGLTLVELMLALAITGVIGAVVATMLFSTSYGTSSHTQMRSLMLRNEVLIRRLNRAVWPAKMVLAKGDNYLVLWMAETWPNDTPNLSELHRIERDPGTNELRSYKAPANLGVGVDTEYDLGSTDFNAVTSALKGTANFPGELWATGLTDWTVTLNSTDPRQSTFVGHRITMTEDGVSETMIGGAPLMNR